MNYINKHLIIIGSLLIIPLFVIGQSGNSVNSLYQSAMQIVKELEEKNFEIVRIEFDVLEENESKKFIFRNMSNQYTYFITAFADQRITDLDLGIGKKDKDSKDRWVDVAGMDCQSKGNFVSCAFTPDESFPHYGIVTSAKAFAQGKKAGRYFVIVAHDLPEIGADNQVKKEEEDKNGLTPQQATPKDKKEEEADNANYEYLVLMSDEKQIITNANSKRKKKMKNATHNARFMINGSGTIIKETSDRGAITYYVDRYELEEETSVFSFFVTSEDGKKLRFELRSEENKLIEYLPNNERNKTVYLISNSYQQK